MNMKYSFITDIGLLREKNQDSCLAIENNYGDFLAIVADGIGGGKAGEVASSEVVKYFEKEFKQSGPFDTTKNAIDYIEYHLNKVNELVFNMSLSNKAYSGMGTTITGIFITKKANISINCGDSRVYGFLDNKYFKLTTDHTLVNQMIENGQISYEESLNHPKRHYLVKAIGIFDEVKCDVHKVKNMQYYLICSDGLHGYVSDDEINSIVCNQNLTLEQKVIELKDISLLKGGYDNVTVILVEK